MRGVKQVGTTPALGAIIRDGHIGESMTREIQMKLLQIINS